jgi:hypothetical protein
VKKLKHKVLARRKRKIEKRLRRRNWTKQAKPMLKTSNIHYQMDGRHKAIAYGGIGAIHLMVKRSGFIKEIDKTVHLLKLHLPYHESDHVLNLAYNIFANCGNCGTSMILCFS